MRLEVIFLLCVHIVLLTDVNATNGAHSNTTRLCRNKCAIPSIPFNQEFVIPSTCGELALFYACRVEINVNYTRRTVSLKFSGYLENSFDMYLVDYNYAIEEALSFAFYRKLFTNEVTFTCLTQDHCADEYSSTVVQRLIDSESILYQLLPLYLYESLENRTITCLNTSGDEIQCYGGYCESITQESAPWWSYRNCGYPSELSVLSTIELTSLTASFSKFNPENSEAEHVNDNRITLLCNVNLCNSIAIRDQGKVILDRYNLAAFGIFNNDTATTVSTSVTISPTTSLTSTDKYVSASTSPSSPNQSNNLRPWQIALITIGVILVVVIAIVSGIFYKKHR